MEKMKAEVTAFRPIFRLLCCRRGLRKNFRGLRPRNFTPKKLSRAVKNLPHETCRRFEDPLCHLPLFPEDHSSKGTQLQTPTNGEQPVDPRWLDTHDLFFSPGFSREVPMGTHGIPWYPALGPVVYPTGNRGTSHGNPRCPARDAFFLPVGSRGIPRGGKKSIPREQ